MKRLLSLLFLIQLYYVVVCFPLRPSHHIYRGIDISYTDPRLFSDADTLFINRLMIDSCLRKMCGKMTIPEDTIERMIADVLTDQLLALNPVTQVKRIRTLKTIPIVPPNIVDISRIEYEIIELANVFVKGKGLSVRYEPHYGTAWPVKKRDLVSLYETFSKVENIESTDILKIINIYKQINNIYRWHSLDEWDWKPYPTEDSLICERDKILQKYKYGVIDSSPCPEGYSLLKDSVISIEEKIRLINWQILTMSGDSKRYDGIFDAEIQRLQQNVDSLRSLIP